MLCVVWCVVFSPYFLSFLLSVVNLSHRTAAPDTVRLFGAAFKQFWILQVVRCCRQWESDPIAARRIFCFLTILFFLSSPKTGVEQKNILCQFQMNSLSFGRVEIILILLKAVFTGRAIQRHLSENFFPLSYHSKIILLSPNFSYPHETHCWSCPQS